MSTEYELPFKRGDIILVVMSNGNCMAGVFVDSGPKPYSMQLMRSGGDVVVLNGSYVASAERIGHVQEVPDGGNDNQEVAG